ncbi:MAG TPA: zinc ribbon domain-containing protein [Candidatus Methanoperedens sp.]|nr:zinc ribbon domain-containing protein [Candidatus Methanoperedens sp.]
MSPVQPQEPFCQSCGMPLDKQENFGSNSDGSQSKEFCRFCFQKGKFTYPDMTLEHMIDIVASLMVTKSDLSVEEAKKKAKSFVPELRRWKP